MEISEELKQKVFDWLEQNKTKLEDIASQLKSQADFVDIPICIDGVMDVIRYSVKEKRYVSVDLQIAKSDISQVMWGINDSNPTTYAGDVEFVTLLLKEDT